MTIVTSALADADIATCRVGRRAAADRPILICTGRSALTIAAGTVVEIMGEAHFFTSDTPVAMPDSLQPGTDYGVMLAGGKSPVAQPAPASDPLYGFFAGFHFAPGGNAEARAGGDAVPAINPFSLWDTGFRPSCDPRGMTRVDIRGGRFWADIYLLGTLHDIQGTSCHGVTIADGVDLPARTNGKGKAKKLDYATATEIYAHHGKRLFGAEEFFAAAYGVTERSAADGDPKTTGLDAARTSRFGLMQATGNLWVWGTDGDPDDPRPSIFGGSWIVGALAGSRDAALACWPGSSAGYISARGACDHLNPA